MALANVREKQWKLAEALVAVDKVMRLEPRNSDMYLFEQGYAYTHLGQWEEAILALKRYSAHYPDFFGPRFFWFRTIVPSAMARPRAETAEIERVIAISPNSAIVYSALALALNLQGRPADALVAAEKGLRLDPRNSELSLYQQGRADTLLGWWEAAIPAIKPYQARYPGDFCAHAYLAVDYMELGRDDAGRAEVAEVLRHDPQFSVETVFPTIGLQRKAMPAEIDRFRADLHKAGLQ